MSVETRLAEIKQGLAKLRSVYERDSLAVSSTLARQYKAIYDTLKPRCDTLEKNAALVASAEKALPSMKGVAGKEAAYASAKKVVDLWYQMADLINGSTGWKVISAMVAGHSAVIDALDDAANDADRAASKAFWAVFKSPWVWMTLTVGGIYVFRAPLSALLTKKFKK